jgi:hypothetical protein
MPLPSVRQALDRDAAIDWYLRNRARSRALFNLLAPDAYYTRPISLRNPVVFYEGHLPAFSVIALIRRGLGRPGVDERLETLFARGIDPKDERAAAAAPARTPCGRRATRYRPTRGVPTKPSSRRCGRRRSTQSADPR